MLEVAFRLKRGFSVPDLLYERELKHYNGSRLVELGLRIEELDADGVARAQHFIRSSPALTIADSFALALAQARAWTLLTGDGPLRALAATEGVDCHGALWLLDQMEQETVVSIQQLYDGLRRISSHVRCRLPAAEVRARLARYSANVDVTR
jgi:hypothetical protein